MLNNETVLTDKPLHFTALKHMAQSPAHCLFAHNRGIDRTPSMIFGSAVHAIAFNQPVIVYGGRRAGNDWAAFKAEHDGALIVTGTEKARADAMVTAMRAHPAARAVLERATTAIEREISWDYCNQSFSSTPDAWGNGVLIDLKTTKDASPDRFPGEILRRAYHAQLACYATAIGTAGLAPPPSEHVIVAVENTAPHHVAVYRIPPAQIEKGQALWRGWFERFMVCKESGRWPGYPDTIIDATDAEDLGLDFGDETPEDL